MSLIIGFQIKIPHRPPKNANEITLGHPDPEDQLRDGTVPYVRELDKRLQKSYEKVRVELQKSAKRQKARHDEKVGRKTFELGDWVWLKNPSRKKGLNQKLRNPYEPYPYRIIEKVSDVIVRLQKDTRRPHRVVHVNHLLKMMRPPTEIEWERLHSTTDSEDTPENPGVIGESNPSLSESDEEEGTEDVSHGEATNPLKRTKGGRTINQPSRFKDYV